MSPRELPATPGILKALLGGAWVAILTLAIGLSSPARAAETSLTLASEPGDPVGNGQQLKFTPSDGTFTVQYDTTTRAIHLSFRDPTLTHYWSLDFAPPAGQSLGVGTYYDAARYSVPFGSQPGLEVHGKGGSCSYLFGSFEIKQVAYGQGTAIDSLWAVFEQHCRGVVPALRGDVRINAEITVAVTAPLEHSVEKGQRIQFQVSAADVTGLPVALSLRDPPPGSAFVDHGDNTGTFAWTPGLSQAGVYPLTFRGENGEGGAESATTRLTVEGLTSLLMDSDAGDYIGEGLLRLFTPAEGPFFANPSMNSSGLVVGMGVYSGYATLSFGSPNDEALHVGTYTGASNFQYPDTPDMSIDAGSRACSTVSGSFEVKEIRVAPNHKVEAFWATFEQHCGGASAALRGEIRYKAAVPFLVLAPLNVGGTETEGIEFEVSVRSDAGNPVGLSAAGLPAGATFVDHGAGTGTFTWTPARGQAGRHTLTFLGDDGAGQTDRAVSRIQVALRNDDFDHALTVPDLPFSDWVDFSLATIAPDDPRCPYLDPSVWYRITRISDERIRISVSGPYSSHLSVYTGTRGALTQMACAAREVSFLAAAGETYFVLATSSGYDGPGTVSLVALPPPPPNDDIGSATMMGALPFADAVDTTSATVAAGDPYCLGSGQTVWYRFAPAEEMVIDADTLGSEYPAAVSVYSGSPAALDSVACSLNRVTVAAHAGRTYYFMVGSYYGRPGGRLAFSATGLPPFEFNLSVDPTGAVSTRTGTAFIHGAVRCSRATTAHLSGQIRQRAGRRIVTSSFELRKPCDAETPWWVMAVGETRSFRGGDAEVRISAYAVDDRTGEATPDPFSGVIRLRRTGKELIPPTGGP